MLHIVFHHSRPKLLRRYFFERCRVVVLVAGRLAGVRGLVVVAHSGQASALREARQQLAQLPEHFFAS